MAKKAKKTTKTKVEKADKAKKALAEKRTAEATAEATNPVEPQEVVQPAKESETIAVAENAPIEKVDEAVGEKPTTPKAEKKAAEKKNADAVTPTLTMQYGGRDIDVKALVQAAKDDFKANHKRTVLKELNLYLKPEDSTMYYVANGSIEGKIGF